MATDILLGADPVDARAAVSRHPELDWTNISILTVATIGALDGLIVHDAIVTAKAQLDAAYPAAREVIQRAQAKLHPAGQLVELEGEPVRTCNAQMSAYEHWHCQLRRWHLGSHRYNNYLGRRFPRVWNVVALHRAIRGGLRLLRCDLRKPEYRKHGYATRQARHLVHQVLWPCRYAPIDNVDLARLRSSTAR